MSISSIVFIARRDILNRMRSFRWCSHHLLPFGVLQFMLSFCVRGFIFSRSTICNPEVNVPLLSTLNESYSAVDSVSSAGLGPHTSGRHSHCNDAVTGSINLRNEETLQFSAAVAGVDGSGTIRDRGGLGISVRLEKGPVYFFYDLQYQMDVFSDFQEDIYEYSLAEVGGDPGHFCYVTDLPKCSTTGGGAPQTPDDTPLPMFSGRCCWCSASNVATGNAKAELFKRSKFKCSPLDVMFGHSVWLTKSCPRIQGPWYSALRFGQWKWDYEIKVVLEWYAATEVDTPSSEDPVFSAAVLEAERRCRDKSLHQLLSLDLSPELRDSSEFEVAAVQNQARELGAFSEPVALPAGPLLDLASTHAMPDEFAKPHHFSEFAKTHHFSAPLQHLASEAPGPMTNPGPQSEQQPGHGQSGSFESPSLWDSLQANSLGDYNACVRYTSREVDFNRVEYVLNSSMPEVFDEKFRIRLRILHSAPQSDSLPPSITDRTLFIPTWPPADKLVQQAAASARRCSTADEVRSAVSPSFNISNSDPAYASTYCVEGALLIPNEFVDLSGARCDVIGTSTRLWGSMRGQFCETSPGSCMGNQLGTFRRVDEKRMAQGKGPLYVVNSHSVSGGIAGAPRFAGLSVTSDSLDFKADNLQYKLGWTYLKEHVTSVQIELSAQNIQWIKSPSPGYIVDVQSVGDLMGPCQAMSENGCQIHVSVFNAGPQAGRFLVLIPYCVRLATTKEGRISSAATIDIAAVAPQAGQISNNETRTISLRLRSIAERDGVYACKIVLNDSDGRRLDQLLHHIAFQKPKHVFQGQQRPVEEPEVNLSFAVGSPSVANFQAVAPAVDLRNIVEGFKVPFEAAVSYHSSCDCSLYSTTCIITNFFGCVARVRAWLISGFSFAGVAASVYMCGPSGMLVLKFLIQRLYGVRRMQQHMFRGGDAPSVAVTGQGATRVPSAGNQMTGNPAVPDGSVDRVPAATVVRGTFFGEPHQQSVSACSSGLDSSFGDLHPKWRSRSAGGRHISILSSPHLSDGNSKTVPQFSECSDDDTQTEEVHLE